MRILDAACVKTSDHTTLMSLMTLRPDVKLFCEEFRSLSKSWSKYKYCFYVDQSIRIDYKCTFDAISVHSLDDRFVCPMNESINWLIKRRCLHQNSNISQIDYFRHFNMLAIAFDSQNKALKNWKNYRHAKQKMLKKNLAIFERKKKLFLFVFLPSHKKSDETLSLYACIIRRYYTYFIIDLATIWICNNLFYLINKMITIIINVCWTLRWHCNST